MNRFVIRALLIVIVTLALLTRITSLDTYGFSDDESSKVRAIAAYRGGDFTANAEHPMLMKLAMWASVAAADRWNAVFPGAYAIAPESALRLPNALIGSAIVVVVCGVVAMLFSPATGLIAAALIALDPNVIALNRIGKEDTFVMFFLFLAQFCYERAKRIGIADLPSAKRWYQRAAGCFGLMLASKYVPYLYGLHVLYNVIYQRDAGSNRPDPGRYYAVMASTFVAGNLAVLSPATWRYCIDYVRGAQLTHHGEMYANQLYVTDFPLSLAGVPVTYYLSLIAMKVPLAVLAAAAVGAIPLFRRRRERGFVWLRVFLLFTLIGFSVFAAKFQRYGLPMLIFIDILGAVGLVAAGGWIGARVRAPMLRASLAAAALTLVLATVAQASWSVAPFYSVHQNAIGAWLEAPISRFPEEAYDFGVREAVADVARQARRDAALVTDAPTLVAYYVRRSGRRDLHVRSFSTEGLATAGEQWVFVQDDHIYFENADCVRQLRRQQTPWREYHIRDATVLQVYNVPDPSSRSSRPERRLMR